MLEDILKLIKDRKIYILAIENKNDKKYQEFIKGLRNLYPYKDTITEINIADYYEENDLPLKFITVVNGIEGILPKYKKNVSALILHRALIKKFVVIPILSFDLFKEVLSDTPLMKVFNKIGMHLILEED